MYNFTIRLQEKNGSRGHGYFFAIGKSKDLAAPMDCQGFPTDCVKDECQVQYCVKDECQVHIWVKAECQVQDCIKDECQVQVWVKDECSVQDCVKDECQVKDCV